jgi:hypothetical protein
MLGWMQQPGKDSEDRKFASTSSLAMGIANSMSGCIETLLTLVQHSVHMSEDHPNSGPGQYEPVTIQLETSTPAGGRIVPVRVLRAASDPQHLDEWLEAADYAATTLITFLSSVTLTSGYISGTPGMRAVKGQGCMGGVCP